MIEILGGNGIENAFHDLGVIATCTYRRKPRDKYDELYEVWEMSDGQFDRWLEKTEGFSDETWKDEWGWWRYARGSIMGAANIEYVVNGKTLLAWDGYNRQHQIDDCKLCSEYYLNNPHHLDQLCYASGEDMEDCFGGRMYKNLLTYLCEEHGVSTERNVCALAVDLARYNHMTLAQLFKTYLD